jgi:hypothetical protein
MRLISSRDAKPLSSQEFEIICNSAVLQISLVLSVQKDKRAPPSLCPKLW